MADYPPHQRFEPADAKPVDVAKALRDSRRRDPRQLHARRLAAGDRVLRPGLPRRRRGARQLRARASSSPTRRGPTTFTDARHPLRRRRHQGPGRRDDHPPHARPPLRRPRRADRLRPTSSTPAATPTSSTCSTASGCASKKISKTEAVQSQLDVPLDRRPDPHRPQRLRPVPEGQQGLLPPHRRHRLRRRAA